MALLTEKFDRSQLEEFCSKVGPSTAAICRFLYDHEERILNEFWLPADDPHIAGYVENGRIVYDGPHPLADIHHIEQLRNAKYQFIIPLDKADEVIALYDPKKAA